MHVVLIQEPQEKAVCVRLETAVVTFGAQQPDAANLNKFVNQVREIGVGVNFLQNAPRMLVLRATANSMCIKMALAKLHTVTEGGSGFGTTFDVGAIPQCAACETARVVIMPCSGRPPADGEVLCGRGVTADRLIRELEREPSMSGRTLSVLCQEWHERS